MLLIKNPQFLPNHNETWPPWPTHELLILTKFHNDWVKIVDFFDKSIFLVESRFVCTYIRQKILHDIATRNTSYFCTLNTFELGKIEIFVMHRPVDFNFWFYIDCPPNIWNPNINLTTFDIILFNRFQLSFQMFTGNQYMK